MSERPRQVVYVPREGFRLDRARMLLGMESDRFRSMLRDLVYGEWIMHAHLQHITCAGMQRLADEAGVELDFERLPASHRSSEPVHVSVPVRVALMRARRLSFIDASLPERDRD